MGATGVVREGVAPHHLTAVKPTHSGNVLRHQEPRPPPTPKTELGRHGHVDALLRGTEHVEARGFALPSNCSSFPVKESSSLRVQQGVLYGGAGA